MNILIIAFPQIKIATLEHLGPKETLPDSVATFRAWRKASGLSPVASKRTFGVAISDPEKTKPEAFRYDICSEVVADVPENDFGVVNRFIPASRCAQTRHIGSHDTLARTVYQFTRGWFPGSGEHSGDFPLFFEYINVADDMPEDHRITDIYLPLKPKAAA